MEEGDMQDGILRGNSKKTEGGMQMFTKEKLRMISLGEKVGTIPWYWSGGSGHRENTLSWYQANCEC